jgi:hypothetical protein
LQVAVGVGDDDGLVLFAADQVRGDRRPAAGRDVNGIVWKRHRDYRIGPRTP